MKSRERALLVGSVMALAALNVAVLFGSTGTPAAAAAPGQDNAVAAAADSAFAQDYAFAFVDVNDVITRLLETPQYKDERETLTATIEGEREEMLAKRQAIMDRYQGMTPEDPRAEQAQVEWSELQAELQEWDQNVSQRVNSMAVEQMEKGYRELIAAVEVVSDRLGIDLVYRFTPPAEPLPAALSGQTMLDIRMRPVLKYPEELNITPEVAEELGLQRE